MNAILNNATAKLEGDWDVLLETDNYQRHSIDGGQHDGRPHELRINLYLQYKPSDEEEGAMQKKIFEYADETAQYDPIPDDVNRRNPEFKWNIFCSFVVNYYGFMSFNTTEVSNLGYEMEEPNADFCYMKWKENGIGAPVSYMYIGDFAKTVSSSGTMLDENFSTITNCRDAKTVILQVQSSEDSVKSTLQTIYGRSTSAKQDIVVLNTAPALINPVGCGAKPNSSFGEQHIA